MQAHSNKILSSELRLDQESKDRNYPNLHSEIELNLD